MNNINLENLYEYSTNTIAKYQTVQQTKHISNDAFEESSAHLTIEKKKKRLRK